jgi:hypothetical protein
MILAVEFRVMSKRGTQFRNWANQHLKEYMIKDFTMDDDRLNNSDGRPEITVYRIGAIRHESNQATGSDILAA